MACVIGSRLVFNKCSPSERDTRGISAIAAVRAKAKPCRAPDRPEPNPLANRFNAYASTGEHPAKAGGASFSSPSLSVPVPIGTSDDDVETNASCALFSSCTKRTALCCRVSASTFARSQKCCRTCPGTSKLPIVATRAGSRRENDRAVGEWRLW